MDTFDVIFTTYSPLVFRYLRSLCGDAAVAEELTAETFYRAYTHFDSFRGDSKLETWLCAIAKNAYLKDCRRSARTSSSTPTKNKNAKARCFPHWKTVPEGSGLCDLRKIRGSRPWSIRREGQRQRLFLALLERLLVEFLALSSSAPLVYWLGCLCSLVALLVVWLDVRFEV